MGILDKFTNIDDLLVSLIERIGGVTEEDTHFFSYPADGTRATVQAGKTTLDFMGGTVMDTDGAVTSLGNSLRARGREYCRSLTLQGDQDIVVQIGTKSKIPIYAGLRFKVSHLRFTEVKIITTAPTELTLIACTNADAVSIDGEIITRTGLGINNFPSDYMKPADVPADYVKPTDLPSDYVKPTDLPSDYVKPIDLPSDYVKPVDLPSDYLKPGQSIDVGNQPSDYMRAGDQVAVNNHPSDYMKSGDQVAVNNHPSDYMKPGNAVAINGQYAGQNKPVLVDHVGRSYSRMLGYENGWIHDIAVDAGGVMLSRMKGADGGSLRDISVDSAGIMLARMKGADGAVLKDVALDSNGIMLSRMKGADGAVLKDILVDSTGIMLARMKGADGAVLKDIALDSNGIMLSRMKGADGGVLKDILVDSTGIMLARMKGAHGGALSDIALDASGNMISVMKGDYNGALKTWKVDTDGRGEMFLSDPTDAWGNINTMGLAEHGVRVHSPPMLGDKRGSVTLYDDYEQTTTRFKTYLSGASFARRSNITSKTGDFSLRLKTDPSAASYVSTLYYTLDFHTNRVGNSVSFAPGDSASMNAGVFSVGVVYYDGTNKHKGGIYIDGVNKQLMIYNSTGGYTNVANLATYFIGLGSVHWNTLKVVVDLSTQKYVRALAYGFEVDLSAYDMYTSASAGQRQLYNWMELNTSSASAAETFVDNFVMTDNEPA